MKRRTNQQFIQESRQVHGDKYDYSKCQYIHAHEKVKIICPVHGEFIQSPNSHIRGAGCAACANVKQKSTPEFIEDAKAAHGNKYDYSHSNYVNWKTHVRIVCPEHGEFLQAPLNHIQGQGCPVCGKGKCRLAITKTLERFIDNAKSLHGEKYDYSMVEYVNTETKVTIICPDHGAFQQKPANHLNGQGCVRCVGLAKKTLEEFVLQSSQVHCDKYDYALAQYKSNRDKLLITCPIHGGFWQSPNSHLKGIGCPSCANHGFNPALPASLYFLQFSKPIGMFWKVGITNRTIEDRFGSDIHCLVERHEWNVQKGEYARLVEKEVLREFKQYKSEIFSPDMLENGGHTECFTSSIPHKEVLKYIQSHIESFHCVEV